MKKEKLNSILLSLESGGRPKGGAISSGIPSLGAEHLNNDGTVKYDVKKFIPLEHFLSLKSGIISKRNILIVKDGATTGKVSYISNSYPYKKSAVNEHVFLLKVNEKIASPEYVFNYLRSNVGQKEILSDFRGATVGGISRKIGEVVKVPLPSLQDQIRIAELLTKAENLITQRKESIALLDELLKSSFLEMFGDPSHNQKKFPKGTIRDVVSEVKYGTSKPAEESGSYRYLRMNNITSNGYMDFSNLKYINLEKNEENKYLVKKGDLLFNRTNSKELVGKTGIYNENNQMAIAGYLIRIRTNEKANPWFLWGYLNSLHGKKTLFSMCKSIVGMANINAQELQEIKIAIPPIELQNQFAAIVEKVEALKSEYQTSLKELENMYGVLSQKAFKGELKIEEYDDFAALDKIAQPIEKISSKVIKLKPTNIEIYKRTLLAAEIVYQLKDTNFIGHLKLQKMLYLCQEIGSMNLPMNFLKQAMGPYDNQLARSLDKQFIIKKWFEYQNGALLKYKPLENCGKHKEDFLKFFENEIEQINYLINKFTKFTSNQIEAVATLYACWKEAIENKELITDKLIITKFYQWSKEKEKFREENLVKALDWMRRNGIEPK